ncbi:MAG: sulfatase [Verrucomicrobiota bacterium]
MSTLHRFCLVAGFLALVPSKDALAANPKRPNILFAIADDWSFGHASVYGCRWVATPGFDRVAKEGVLFTRAYTPNAKCAPSRSSILTGRNPWQLEAAANHNPIFPASFRTYPEALAQNGYFVGMVGKGWGPGEAKDAEGKPREMAGRPFAKKHIPQPTSGISGNDYSGNFEEFLKAAPSEQPWCFWYGGHEPHRNYEYGSGVAKGGKKLSDIDRIPAFWPDTEEVRNDMLDYAFEVEHFDRALLKMLQILEARGELDNTFVLVTSDNGMPFPRSKGQNYEIANHLPLAVRWPAGIPKSGRTVDDFVSFIDYAPTIAEVAQVPWEKLGMAPATGRSFLNVLQSEKTGQVDPTRDHVILGRERNDVGRPNDEGYPVRSIVKGGLIYSHNFESSRWPTGNPETGYRDCDSSPTKTSIIHAHRENRADPFWALCFGKRGSDELFDLKNDPDCVNDLAGQPVYLALQNTLKEQLLSELRSQEDPRVLGRGGEIEAYPYSNADRGYYNRFMENGGAMPSKKKGEGISPDDFDPLPKLEPKSE